MTGTILIDLGFGDSGKGTTVDLLADDLEANTVVRYTGGPQAGHTVMRGDKKHTFRLLGSHLLACPSGYTVLTDTVISAGVLAKECIALTELTGINPYGNTRIMPQCPITTRYHQCANLIDAAETGHSTCGHGVGMVRELAQFGLVLTAAELANGSIGAKLKAIQEALLDLLNDRRYSSKLTTAKYWEALNAPLSMEADKQLIGPLVKNGIAELPISEHVIFEGAQGLLLDEFWGFAPHNTWADITSANALRFHYEHLPHLQIATLGIIRALPTRHGSGPFPSECSRYVPSAAEANQYNPLQGNFRGGWPDLPLLRYATNACPIDGLVVTHIDGLPKEATRVLMHYDAASTAELTLKTKTPLTPPIPASFFDAVKPQFQEVPTNSLLYVLEAAANAPITITSTGPTATDKQFHQL